MLKIIAMTLFMISSLHAQDHDRKVEAEAIKKSMPGTRDTMSGTVNTPTTKAAANTPGSGTVETAPIDIPDVETLLDNLGHYDNQRVTVTGKMKRSLGDRAIVLKSGGLFKNEIVVLLDKDQAISKFNSRTPLKVTGRVHKIDSENLQDEMGWIPREQAADEIKKSGRFLAAERVYSSQNAK